MKMNMIFLAVAIIAVLFILYSKKNGYKTVPPRVEDKDVEVASVADVALKGGACGVRPTLV
jgi:hypothetical protein